jgi:hypothetical protein
VLINTKTEDLPPSKPSLAFSANDFTHLHSTARSTTPTFSITSLRAQLIALDFTLRTLLFMTLINVGVIRWFSYVFRR